LLQIGELAVAYTAAREVSEADLKEFQKKREEDLAVTLKQRYAICLEIDTCLLEVSESTNKLGILLGTALSVATRSLPSYLRAEHSLPGRFLLFCWLPVTRKSFSTNGGGGLGRRSQATAGSLPGLKSAG
jgi:hypothetical protein